MAFLGIPVDMLFQPVGIAWKRAAARAAGAALIVSHVHARDASAAIRAYQQAEAAEAAAWEALVAAAAGRPFTLAEPESPRPADAADAACAPRPAPREARPRRAAPKATSAPRKRAPAGARICVDPDGCSNVAGPRGLCSTHRHRRERDGTFEDVALPPLPGSGGRWTRRPRPPKKVAPPG